MIGIHILEFIKDSLESIGKDLVFTAICGIITILGFVITLLILFKTKSISRKIEEYKINKDYNKRRTKLRSSLLGYKNALLQDNVEIKKIKGNILDDLNALYENYKTTFNMKQKIVIKSLKGRLEKENKHNRNKICNKMSKVASYLYNKKEDVL